MQQINGKHDMLGYANLSLIILFHMSANSDTDSENTFWSPLFEGWGSRPPLQITSKGDQKVFSLSVFRFR